MKGMGGNMAGVGNREGVGHRDGVGNREGAGNREGEGHMDGVRNREGVGNREEEGTVHNGKIVDVRLLLVEGLLLLGLLVVLDGKDLCSRGKKTCVRCWAHVPRNLNLSSRHRLGMLVLLVEGHREMGDPWNVMKTGLRKKMNSVSLYGFTTGRSRIYGDLAAFAARFLHLKRDSKMLMFG